MLGEHEKSLKCFKRRIRYLSFVPFHETSSLTPKTHKYRLGTSLIKNGGFGESL